VNAIADALSPFGELRLDFPLTPTKLLEVIEGRSLAKREGPPPASSAPQVQAVAPPPTLAAASAGAPQVPAASAPATVIDGTWKLTLATPLGPQTFTAEFETNGSVITGRLMQGDFEPAPFEGTVDGTKAVWDLKVTKPIKITLKYNVEFDGPKLVGKVKMGIFGTAKLVGERMP
jgi:aerobic carbon-monoxide dehydrogenase large subunit